MCHVQSSFSRCTLLIQSIATKGLPGVMLHREHSRLWSNYITKVDLDCTTLQLIDTKHVSGNIISLL